MPKKKKRSQTQAKKLWLLHRPPLKRKRRNRVKRKGLVRSKSKRLNDSSGNGETFHLKCSPITSTFDISVNKADKDSRRNFFHLLTMGVNRVNVVLQCGVNGITGFMNNMANCVYIGAVQVKKTLKCSQDVLFPGRAYKRKFDEMAERLDTLENEVKRLKSVSEDRCCCHHLSRQASQTSAHGIHLHAPCHHSVTKGHLLASSPNQNQAVYSVSIPPPPPPPPPPPAPPPVPKVAAQPQKLNAVKNKRADNNAAKVGVNQNSGQFVSLDELKKVKLRKVSCQDPSLNKIGGTSERKLLSPATKAVVRFPLKNRNTCESAQKQLKTLGRHPPMITLGELQAVSLKKAQHDFPGDRFQRRTPDENGHMTAIRNRLRKVNIERSPGGTPLVRSRSSESGDGFTPMMTRALRKKFQHAHPRSSSPISPASRMTTLSPRTASPVSPMLFPMR